MEDGFTMMQYSVYMRHSSSDENAQVHAKRVKARMPDDGEVRIIKITDKQFGKNRGVLWEKTRTDRTSTASTPVFLKLKQYLI